MSDMNDSCRRWVFGFGTPLGLHIFSIGHIRFFVGFDPRQPLPFFRRRTCRNSYSATEDQNRTCQTRVLAEWLLPVSK